MNKEKTKKNRFKRIIYIGVSTFLLGAASYSYGIYGLISKPNIEVVAQLNELEGLKSIKERLDQKENSIYLGKERERYNALKEELSELCDSRIKNVKNNLENSLEYTQHKSNQDKGILFSGIGLLLISIGGGAYITGLKKDIREKELDKVKLEMN